MVRTIVYRRAEASAVAQAAGVPPSPPPDNYGDKLVKYIPAEVISLYAALYSYATSQGGRPAGWFMLVVCLSGTVGYLYIRTHPAHPPTWYFYVLAALAFFAWALGTSSVGKDLLDLPEYVSKVALPFAVFAVPLLDEVLTKLLS